MGVLEQLLAQARNGDISGLLFCVRLSSNHHAMGISGIYHADPTQAVTGCGRMKHRLNLMIDAMEVCSAPVTNTAH